MNMSQLPTETLTAILVHLPYESLLRAMGVCRRWKGVIDRDPKLRLSMFKPPGEPIACGQPEAAYSAVERGVMLHPALVNRVRYRLGDLPSSASFPWGQSLADHSVIHDLACIPPAQNMSIIVARKPPNPAWKPTLYIKVGVTNPYGVCVGDVFDAMARVSRERVHHDVVDLASGWSFQHPSYPAALPSPPLSVKADMLGSKKLFVGLVEAVWKGIGVEATAYTVM